mmetsp:Transcript_42085/g.58872  ORF Transcript_42085/g.58872 Transcript_42085/m.58872 type:complete len:244 (+) Transcript_42085:54-785(+)
MIQSNSSSLLTFQNLFDFSSISPGVKDHLQRVYGTLGTGLLAATAGSLLPTMYPSLLSINQTVLFLGTIVLLFILMGTPNTPGNLSTRFLLYLGFCGMKGFSLFYLFAALSADSSTIATALGGTVAIFSCFSLAAIFAPDRKFLYLGGILSSALMLMLMTTFLNLFASFFGYASESLFMGVNVYFGLLVFMGFVLFDTQLIIAKAKSGNTDFILHALELFLDFINIFVRLLILFGKDKKKRKN